MVNRIVIFVHIDDPQWCRVTGLVYVGSVYHLMCHWNAFCQSLDGLWHWACHTSHPPKLILNTTKKIGLVLDLSLWGPNWGNEFLKPLSISRESSSPPYFFFCAGSIPWTLPSSNQPWWKSSTYRWFPQLWASVSDGDGPAMFDYRRISQYPSNILVILHEYYMNIPFTRG